MKGAVREREPAAKPAAAEPEGFSISESALQEAFDYLDASAQQIEAVKRNQLQLRRAVEKAYGAALKLSRFTKLEERKADARDNKRVAHYQELLDEQTAVLAGFEAKASAAKHKISAWQTAQRTGPRV